jgi:aminopeptidase-like protein
MVAIADQLSGIDREQIGRDAHRLITELYPICRSITGDGVRETLRRVSERIPVEVVEVPTGTPVLDWTVPREWNIRDAYVADASGRRIIDFRASNLHVLNYSVPVSQRMTLAELRPHLHTLPEQPDRIPYRTSYYNDAWGFCLQHERLAELRDDEEYEVVIDSSLQPGHLSYGELVLPGSGAAEVLVSCHLCHPSLCNDNLSGIAVATLLAQALSAAPRRHTFRFVFVPGTIGSISWLAANEDAVGRIASGLVLTGVGDPGSPTYKQSRRGNAAIDRAMAHVLATRRPDHAVVPFSPWGYDERQYCSPGFDLPVGCLMRTPHGTYPEYHTSGDDPGFVTPDALAETYELCLAAFDVLERDATYRNLSPKGEPQLGRRGLYGALGGSADKRSDELAMLWVLNQSDGEHTLLSIAERSGLPFATVAKAAALLEDHGLLAPVGAAGEAAATRR